ncbi:glycosyltransferase [Aerococcaceae bacterium DSM 109653]|uniref:Glycosyltransferase n=1 Tax=Fundicoccus ignavus TaxID=2664442 RepID=A0A844BKW9_9LACT|nr:glycosyltransferase [Fundicoccus ignavus]
MRAQERCFILKVSIIIPMYNAEATIERMLQSIQQQTYPCFTVLLIDDGSTDGTKQQCQPFIQKDQRYKYHYQANGGVSSARNYGLSLSRHPYIVFLDSDDKIEPDFLERMLQPFRADDQIDFVACSFDRNDVSHLIDRKKLSAREVISDLIEPDGPMGYSCNKMFKQSIIKEHEIRFDESVHYGEDLLFCITYLLNARKAQYHSEVLFHYIVHGKSKSANLRDTKTLTHIDALEQIISLLETNEVDQLIITKYLMVYYRITLGYLFRHNLKLSNQNLEKFEQVIKKIDYSIIHNRFLEFKILLGKLYIRWHKKIKS